MLVFSDIKKGLFLTLVALVICLSFFIPSETSQLYNNLYFSIFLLLTFLFFRIKKKKNYFDFDSIFIIVYAIVAFVFPVFLFSFSTPFSEFFGLKYNINLVSKGVYIALLGISGYYVGSIYKYRGETTIENHNNEKVNTRLLSLIVLILSILFYFLGGVQYYQAIYLKSITAPSGPVVQVMALLQAFMLTAIATEAYNHKVNNEYRYSSFFLIICIGVSFLLLYAGNRTSASFFLLPLMYWYMKNYKPINFIKFSVLIVFAIISMWIIQQTRSGINVQLNAGVGVFKDLTIVNRNTYIGIEYTDKYGYTYGKSMINGVVGVIPTFERFLNNLFGIEISRWGSAEIFTDYTFRGKPNNLGLGTNIFIDIFLSFGYVGTFLLMFLLGYFVKYAYNKTNELSYNYYIIYTVLVASSVFWVRSGFAFPIRLILWSLIIGNLNKSIVKRFIIILRN
jgi:oligosaccharide repeat unit polymerase